MTLAVVDASALAAIVFGEPEGPFIADRLDGAAILAPALLKFELANVAWKKIRREASDPAIILTALHDALHRDWHISWREVDHADIVLIAQALGLSTYDASYVWLAGSLGADLVTLDQKLIAATARLSA